jgi:diacylglycerol kinase family enzyme
MAPDPHAKLPMRHILVLLNARAGAMMHRGADGLRERLSAAFGGGVDIEMHILEPRRMLGAIARAAVTAHDTVVIGGGDGSVSAAVHALASSGKTLGVLPCGTLNLLARDLGMPDDVDAAIAALARAQPTRIDLASINGRRFHSLSGLGFFSQMARAREESRDLPHKILRVGAAALRALSRNGRLSVAIDVDGHRQAIDTYALLVTCNRFSASDWRRQALDGGAMEIHVARHQGALDRLKAGADLLTGAWRDSDGIESFSAKSVTIAATRRRAWVATDGELARETTPLAYTIHPRALTVLAVPAG